MNRRLAGLLASVFAVSIVLAQPAGAVLVCPDGHVLFPVQNAQDEQKDHNGNGFVCKKVNSQGQAVGGPDDTTDDIVV